MKQPYELKALGEKIAEKAKADGLTIAEEALEKLGKAVYLGSKEWFSESAAMTETKADDVIVAISNLADPMVLPQIEKLDLDGDGK